MTTATLRDLLPKFQERDARNPEAYPAGNIADLYAAGVPLMPFPKALGGRGASLTDATLAIEALASASPSTALIVAMPLGLAGVFGLDSGVAPDHFRAGWIEQAEQVAGDYRAAKLYAACNSEKGAGGSLDATKTVAARDKDGVFRLTGEKILASSGKFADYFFSTGKVSQADLPGAGVVEFFFLETNADGVTISEDWDGFGMRSTESQTVRYDSAPASAMLGFPNFIATVQPLQYFYHLFAAIPLGCAGAIIRELSDPAPTGPAMRVRLNDALMRYEALRAYLLETAGAWRPSAGPAYAGRVLRMKSYVTQESTRLCAELFALGGGRHYRRGGRIAGLVTDSFAGTALRPPLPLALEMLAENFSTGDGWESGYLSG